MAAQPELRIGSSPRVRGTEDAIPQGGREIRFIPARAGNGKTHYARNVLRPVHPRACGERVVGASLPISDALFPVRRQEGGITTWAAIHNLESSPGLLRCDLMREGVLLDAASIPLEANGQTSWFIDQAFPAADTSDFAGSVRCDAVGEGLFSAGGRGDR